MPVTKLRKFLDDKKIKYVVISHSPYYTAQEIAASAHIPGKELAKTVMIKIDGKMSMAVIPASFNINFQLLKKALGKKEIDLASEEEFKYLFPDCEIGAMPPFGNLYECDVIVSESLAEDKEIAFNAGSHNELIKMSYEDYFKVVKPKVLKFTEKSI